MLLWRIVITLSLFQKTFAKLHGKFFLIINLSEIPVKEESSKLLYNYASRII